ncbi:hypothetical protein HYALB_00013903 [Hymenoscyphus albidus]|uniref:Uncharacterized protein n=1 Tax=Hymenoscyphus albidus TaxID=595503 RepID=A0A9N9M108_9HELO|nr:hypothetical protein HYALB_00013903 [Hymenoscyphus albidus]
MSKADAPMLKHSHTREQPGHDIFGTPRNDAFCDAHVYDILDSSKRKVRLLRILPDHGAGLVDCEMLCKKPLKTIRGTYSALSYCAGVPNKTQWITVNGVKFRAFANLVQALAEARYFWKKMYGSKEFLLWVDQLHRPVKYFRKISTSWAYARYIFVRSGSSYMPVNKKCQWPRHPMVTELESTRPSTR